MIDKLQEEKGKARVLSEDLQLWLHKFVLDNSSLLEVYTEYDLLLKNKLSRYFIWFYA
jgi:hypothetical protein